MPLVFDLDVIQFMFKLVVDIVDCKFRLCHGLFDPLVPESVWQYFLLHVFMHVFCHLVEFLVVFVLTDLNCKGGLASSLRTWQLPSQQRYFRLIRTYLVALVSHWLRGPAKLLAVIGCHALLLQAGWIAVILCYHDFTSA